MPRLYYAVNEPWEDDISRIAGHSC